MAKKRKDRRGKKHGQQQQSFKDFMLDQTLNKFRGYIDSQIQVVGQILQRQNQSTFEMLYMRALILEEILCEKFEDVTKESLSMLVAEKQDERDGFESADVVELGDRVRVEFKFKPDKEDAEWSKSSRQQLDNVGSGMTMGEELEKEVIGMKTGEKKEFQFGNEKNKQVGYFYVNKISRKPKPPAKEEAKKEESNASPNAE